MTAGQMIEFLAQENWWMPQILLNQCCMSPKRSFPYEWFLHEVQCAKSIKSIKLIQYKNVRWSKQYDSFVILCWNWTGHWYIQLWLSFSYVATSAVLQSSLFPKQCVPSHPFSYSRPGNSLKLYFRKLGSLWLQQSAFPPFSVKFFLNTVLALSRKQICTSVSQGNQYGCGCLSPGFCSCTSKDICLKLNLYKLLKSKLPATFWLFQ